MYERLEVTKRAKVLKAGPSVLKRMDDVASWVLQDGARESRLLNLSPGLWRCSSTKLEHKPAKPHRCRHRAPKHCSWTSLDLKVSIWSFWGPHPVGGCKRCHAGRMWEVRYTWAAALLASLPLEY